MNNSIGGIASNTPHVAPPIQGSNNPLLNLQKEEGVNIILDPVSDNDGGIQPANNTPSSSILAVWQKYLNNQKRLYKFFYGPGATHSDRTKQTDTAATTNNTNLNSAHTLDHKLTSQIAKQAQEILDNKG
ncbi:MAG: hypothetical protein K2W99_06475 [Chthoniobacterales bacterium]|nr:hypothetical protein [Chthoniobacterales bacterium]